MALDVHLDYQDPPVLFLSHEGDYHFYLADSFTEFLNNWEKLYYCSLPPSEPLCSSDSKLDPTASWIGRLGEFLLTKSTIDPTHDALATLVEKHINPAIYQPGLVDKIRIGEVSPINWVTINVDKSKLSIEELDLLQSLK